MVSSKETILVKVMKSLWYTVVLWLVIVFSSVILMGIEGNHHQLVQWRNMEELEQFNKSLYKWITKTDSAAATSLREKIGLNGQLGEAEYEEKALTQFEANFTQIFKRMKANCTLATHDLKSWNNMTQSTGDAFMYAVSILSTVGWGVAYPPTNDLRVVTIFYALLGVPLFGAFIGYQMSFVEYVENRMKRNRFVKTYLGGVTTINVCMGVVMLTIALIYCSISMFMVNEEKNDPELAHDLAVIGEKDHWTYFTTIYFTFQVVSTIGFGDEFIYSREKSSLSFIKPIFLIIFIAFLIALFTHVFGKIQRGVDKRADKKSRQSSMAIRSISLGVKRASTVMIGKQSQRILIANRIEEEKDIDEASSMTNQVTN